MDQLYALSPFTPLLIIMALTFFVVLCITWICLPFAIFGTKPLLRELIEATNKSNGGKPSGGKPLWFDVDSTK